MPTKNHVSKQIKRLRVENKLSQERFAKKVGLSPKTISAYEKGRIIPSSRILEKISEVYDTSILNFYADHHDHIKKKLEDLEKNLSAIKQLLQ